MTVPVTHYKRAQQEIVDAYLTERDFDADSDGSRVEWMYKRAAEYKVAIHILTRALEMCNESRNRLTRFQRLGDGWIHEAVVELKGQDAMAEETTGNVPAAVSTDGLQGADRSKAHNQEVLLGRLPAAGRPGDAETEAGTAL
jgi:hypothetical protein